MRSFNLILSTNATNFQLHMGCGIFYLPSFSRSAKHGNLFRPEGRVSVSRCLFSRWKIQCSFWEEPSKKLNHNQKWPLKLFHWAAEGHRITLPAFVYK